MDPAVDMKGITMRFGKVVANDKVNFSVEKGEILALVGENGAGKSTLIKILTGVYSLDEGTVYWNGQPVAIHTPADSRKIGINVIHQDHVLIPAFDAVENVYLGMEYPGRGGTIDWKQMKERVQHKAQELGISITIATGRDKGGIDFVYEPLELEHRGNNFVAGVNGQIIYDFHKKEYFVDKVLDGSDAKKVMALGMKYNFEVISCCGYDFYDLISKRLKAMKKVRSVVFGQPMDYGFNQGKRNFIPLEDADYEIMQDVNKFVLIQTASFFKKHLPHLRKELKDYDLLEVGPAWIEVMPKGVSKASALLRIGEKLGISTDEMMAFGDAENDMEMIKTVKYGIAMGNAMESLKKAAWDVTDTNDQMGIAKALDKYVFASGE